ncbi:MAG: AI-2E family transporter [Candidatus Methylacidiphilales bacterium]|nr:AI-2E family transporter [Candidatus Methylacidiphilales bacterium]
MPGYDDTPLDQYPTPKQKAVIWAAVTSLSWVIILAIVAAGAYLAMLLMSLLYPVLLPIGVAGVLAFLLDPAVEALVKRGFSRSASIWTLLAAVVLVLCIILLFIIPPLIEEIINFKTNASQYWTQGRAAVEHYLQVNKAVSGYITDHLTDIQNFIWGSLKNVSSPLQHIFSWIGFVVSFVFVPVFAYYFLIEKEAIEQNWEKYLPLHRTWWREEVVIVLKEINNYLVIFFRGQVVVAMIVGVLTSIGLEIIGLKYALIIGMIAGILGIIPYVGIATSLVSALVLGYITQDAGTAIWLMPLKVITVFSIVQFVEGFFITPRIMGEATGLHPVAIMISILVWSIILPGFLGPLLAVPFTATLRVLMYRYIWLPATHHDEDDPNAPPPVVLADGSPATQRVALVPVKKPAAKKSE